GGGEDWREPGELEARRVDRPRREDEIVGEGVRLAVAPGAETRGERPTPARKASFIAVARQREERERLALFAEPEIDARLKCVRDAGRRDRLIKQPDWRSAVDGRCLAVSVAPNDAQIGAVRLRQWERRVGFNGRERGDLRAVINVVVLVSSEEKNLVLDQRAAGARAGVVILERDAEAARRVGVAPVGIGVEAFVTEVVEGLPVKLIRAAAQTQV